MQFKLIVVQPFGDYQKGTEITDPESIESILGGEQASYVVKVGNPTPDEQTAS